jgi:hypothetical protein
LSLRAKREIKQFARLAIEDTMESYFFPAKPAFPVGGKEFECPNCGHKSTYSEPILCICPDDWVQF